MLDTRKTATAATVNVFDFVPLSPFVMLAIEEPYGLGYISRCICGIRERVLREIHNSLEKNAKNQATERYGATFLCQFNPFFILRGSEGMFSRRDSLPRS